MLFKLGHIPSPANRWNSKAAVSPSTAMERNRISNVQIEKFVAQRKPKLLGLDPKPARYTGPRRSCCSRCVFYLIRQTSVRFRHRPDVRVSSLPAARPIDRRLSWKTRTPALALTFVLVIGLLVVFGVFIGDKRRQAGHATGGSDQESRVRQARQGMDRASRARGRANRAALRSRFSECCPSLSLHVLSASRNLIYLVIIPILSFFILKDGRQIRDSFLDLLRQRPEGRRRDADGRPYADAAVHAGAAVPLPRDAD